MQNKIVNSFLLFIFLTDINGYCSNNSNPDISRQYQLNVNSDIQNIPQYNQVNSNDNSEQNLLQYDQINSNDNNDQNIIQSNQINVDNSNEQDIIRLNQINIDNNELNLSQQSQVNLFELDNVPQYLNTSYSPVYYDLNDKGDDEDSYDVIHISEQLKLKEPIDYFIENHNYVISKLKDIISKYLENRKYIKNLIKETISYLNKINYDLNSYNNDNNSKESLKDYISIEIKKYINSIKYLRKKIKYNISLSLNKRFIIRKEIQECVDKTKQTLTTIENTESNPNDSLGLELY